MPINSAVPDIPFISQRLAVYNPKRLDTTGQRRAAVALILREQNDEAEILFIERAQWEGDPWSGQMAFPGGGVDESDQDSINAAERETLEEVGLELATNQRLGQIDDLQGRHSGRPARLVISCFVYHVDKPPPLQPNYEVEDALWVPCSTLLEPSNTVTYHPPIVPGMVYPGIRVGEKKTHLIWGLTHRFLDSFFATLGQDLPRINENH